MVEKEGECFVIDFHKNIFKLMTSWGHISYEKEMLNENFQEKENKITRSVFAKIMKERKWGARKSEKHLIWFLTVSFYQRNYLYFGDVWFLS